MDLSRLSRAEISGLRQKLLSNGWDLCLGELCRGKIKEVGDFCRNRHLCKSCNNHRVQKSYQTKGRSSERSIDESKQNSSCSVCSHNNPVHIIPLTASAVSDPQLPPYSRRAMRWQFICIWCQRLRSTPKPTRDPRSAPKVEPLEGETKKMPRSVVPGTRTSSRPFLPAERSTVRSM